MREIALSSGEPPLRVYDTSGPQGHDVRDGLPKLRRDWMRARESRRTSSSVPRLTARAGGDAPRTVR